MLERTEKLSPQEVIDSTIPDIPDVSRRFADVGLLTPDLATALIAGAAVIAAPTRMGRRDILTITGLAAAVTALKQPEVIEAAGFKIVPVDPKPEPTDQRASFPWRPAAADTENSLRATGRNHGGLFWASDETDSWLRGGDSRPVQMKKQGFKYEGKPIGSTVELIEAVDNGLIARRAGYRAALGMCYGAAVSTNEAPYVNEGLLIKLAEGIEVSVPLFERRMASSVKNSDRARRRIDPNDPEALRDHIKQGDSVVINFSRSRDEWLAFYAGARDVINGVVWATRYLKADEDPYAEPQIVTIPLGAVHESYLIEPVGVINAANRQAGNSTVIPEHIYQLFSGTHRLVDGAGNPRSFSTRQ